MRAQSYTPPASISDCVCEDWLLAPTLKENFELQLKLHLPWVTSRLFKDKKLN